VGSKWQTAGGKAGGTQVGRQQEKHSSKLGVPTRELVAQALGCELGSLGWSRARYGASQSGRQQGCGQGRRRWTVGGISISTTVPWGVHVRLRYGTATLRLRAAVGQTRHSESSGRAAAGQSGRGHLTTMERGRNGTVQLRQRGVGTRGLVDSDGALFLKATSTMEGARWVGLTSTRTAPRPPRA
jgi:hypothetical protein